MAEAGVIEWRDLHLEDHRIRSGASRYRDGDVGWLDFPAPHKHLVVDVTVTSARTNSNVPAVGASLPLLGSLAMGAQQTKLDIDFRTTSSLCTPSILCVHEYYPFGLKDGGLLAHMAVDLVDRLAILVVVRRFPSMGATHSRSLSCPHEGLYSAVYMYYLPSIYWGCAS
jgi:hypothetical protein